jgi:UTP--glucose-1-phosphate uridylyltransferase
MEILRRNAADHDDLVLLSPALAELAARERYLAMELRGTRFNIGVKYGILFAQLALALSGDDRDDILARLLELAASRLRDAT